jgi:hypothetical protein
VRGGDEEREERGKMEGDGEDKEWWVVGSESKKTVYGKREMREGGEGGGGEGGDERGRVVEV